MTARAVVAAMTAYTLELSEAEIKLNQNESPYDFPFKRELLGSLAARPWNLYPDFESTALRTAVAEAYSFAPENILVGNGSNELLAATVGTFVGPGTPVVFPRPTFALYEKLVTIAGGVTVPVDLDPASGFLPLNEMLRALDGLQGAVAIVCSPNNPTGGVLPPGGIEKLLATGATVLLDRAYGEFALDELPPLHDRLITFSTFSKAWGLAALRVGWLASTAATCREIRKVKLPYSLNIVSEAIAAAALQRRDICDANVARTIAERERVLAAMRAMETKDGVILSEAKDLLARDGEDPSPSSRLRMTPVPERAITIFPTRANFIAFRTRATLDDFLARGVLIRKTALPGVLRVSIGTREQNDRFLAALEAIVFRDSGERAGCPPPIEAEVRS